MKFDEVADDTEDDVHTPAERAAAAVAWAILPTANK